MLPLTSPTSSSHPPSHPFPRSALPPLSLFSVHTPSLTYLTPILRVIYHIIYTFIYNQADLGYQLKILRWPLFLFNRGELTVAMPSTHLPLLSSPQPTNPWFRSKSSQSSIKQLSNLSNNQLRHQQRWLLLLYLGGNVQRRHLERTRQPSRSSPLISPTLSENHLPARQLPRDWSFKPKPLAALSA